jgi:anti-sigma regulatory factor (Ser/Thr protein kinase)
VKSIFSKIFGSEVHGNSADPQLAQLPSSPSIDSLFEAQKRSLIGVVARKMAIQISVDKIVQDSIMVLALATESFAGNKKDESDYLLFLAEHLVIWVKEKEDVFFRVRELGMSGKYYEAFLSVYEDVKEELSSIFHPNSLSDREPLSSQDEIWQVYRDVIFAATQRKFLLIQNNEVSKYKEGRILCEIIIKERQDIPMSRESAKIQLLKNEMNQTQVMSILLVISEATTNILKHAEEGKMTITLNERRLYVVVEDKGPGFDLKLLPNMTLLTGYSTKKSLGQGFTLMMKMAEQVLLSTTSEGSVIILMFEMKEGAASEDKSIV